jgi:serine/threonine-protein kinase
MEYLAGESLSMLVKTCRKKNNPLPPELAAGIIMQAAEGLYHAHTMVGSDGKPMNIVHRDVSPQNIFVLYDGGVKVVDFGIAKATTRSTHTRTGTLKGKFAYMSPEQILGESLDGRSDVFSLGIVLWECLTGRKLYRQESDLKLLQAVTQQDAPSPAQLNPSLPEEVSAVTLKALSRDQKTRYESAAAMRNALRDFLRHAQASADTMAIGTFMQETFAQQIQDKRLLIESAKESDSDLSDYLFGDLKHYIADTDVSIPHTTPSIPIGKRPQPASWRRPLFMLFMAGLLAGAGVVIGFLLPKGGGNEKRDASVVVTGSPPDAGLDAAHKADPGPRLAAQADAGPDGRDAGAQVADTSTQVASRDKPDARRKKKKKKRKKKRLVRNGTRKDPPKQPEPDPALPPGRLRLITNPWTDVYFKGRKLGQTPLIDVELPAGQVKLRVKNEDAGIDQELVIHIKSGERAVKRFNLF